MTPHRLAFALQKLLTAETRFGDQLATREEHSRRGGIPMQCDDATAFRSTSADSRSAIESRGACRDLESAKVHRATVGRGAFTNQGGESGQYQCELLEREVQTSNRLQFRRLRRAHPNRKSQGAFRRCRSSDQRNRVCGRLSITLAIQSSF